MFDFTKSIFFAKVYSEFDRLLKMPKKVLLMLFLDLICGRQQWAIGQARMHAAVFAWAEAHNIT